ncbi:mucoidy inhibitor MuiA family protein [Flavobacteriales bacterium]|nr:mucoidy inhibitor MuiA family protein [Flavobacteriales bacterium]
MAQKLSFIIPLFLCLTIFGQQNQIQTESKITGVTVFLSGAQVTREASVSLPAGSRTIVFENLTQYINKSSLQIKANNDAITILSVGHKVNYLESHENDQRIAVLKDSLEKIRFNLDIRNSHQIVYKEEKTMLLANKSIAGEQNGVDIEDLMEMADFYRERLQEIETKLLDIRTSKTNLNKIISRLNKELKNANSPQGKYTSDVIVKVAAKVKSTTKFELSYITNNASWTPKYDIRTKDINKPIALTYKAEIAQNTGFDWKKVNIKLSTGNPSIKNTQPVVSPWHLAYYNDYKAKKNRAKGRTQNAQAYAEASDDYSNQGSSLEDYDKMFYSEGLSSADFTSVTQSNVNTTFKIALPYTIKSNGESELIEIQNYDLPVGYQYFSAPKTDKDAFLLANIIEWGDYYLLPGYANVYFEGTYIGESYLNTNTTDDTLAVSMGRDKGIVITREKIKDFCKNARFAGKKKSTRGYEIKVRNNKPKAIEIEIVDQIPLSKIKEIEVEVLENSSAEYDETTGKLIWKLTIQPGEIAEVSFKFQVKYPKDKNLSNL